jgi:hypothetical protein
MRSHLSDLLLQSQLGDVYTIASGTNPVTAALALVTAANVGLDTSTWQVTPTDDTTPAIQEYQPGDSILDIINGLLKSYGYEHLHFDDNGRGRIIPYVSPIDRESEFSYIADGSAAIYHEIEIEQEPSSVANRIVFINTDPNRSDIVITSTKTVTNPLLPTVPSAQWPVLTVPYIHRFHKPKDQTGTDNLSVRILTEWNSIFALVPRLKIGINIFHLHKDIIIFGDNTARVNLGIAPKKFIIEEWVTPLDPKGATSLYCKEAIDVMAA